MFTNLGDNWMIWAPQGTHWLGGMKENASSWACFYSLFSRVTYRLASRICVIEAWALVKNKDELPSMYVILSFDQMQISITLPSEISQLDGGWRIQVPTKVLTLLFSGYCSTWQSPSMSNVDKSNHLSFSGTTMQSAHLFFFQNFGLQSTSS